MSEIAKILYRLNKEYRATGNETITIDSGVAKLTPPTNAVYAIIYVESDITSGYVLRYWTDGSSPTTTTGIPRQVDTAFDIEGIHNLNRFRATEVDPGTSQIQVQYYE